jgi:hypothetical protein
MVPREEKENNLGRRLWTCMPTLELRMLLVARDLLPNGVTDIVSGQNGQDRESGAERRKRDCPILGHRRPDPQCVLQAVGCVHGLDPNRPHSFAAQLVYLLRTEYAHFGDRGMCSCHVVAVK